ncbi:hypothetical protein [Acidianus manzaensis]|uniref:hypothetical protein n=1 Tax=Acidianus manzaensis TaxID=282676 RepID=UPI001F25645B|nr:hypothetical protein [Acidianus manzaensis]
MIDKIKEETILGTLLFISSFYLGEHYFYLSIILIYALASYLQLKYFAPIVSSILLVFSPLHSLLVLIPYPLLFLNRRFSISFLLSTFFALLTENYLVLLLSFSLDRKGLISSGIFFLILSGIFMNVGYGNLAFFLLVSGVISTLVEERIKIDIKTSAVIYLSSLLMFFKLPYVIPFLLSFSPLSSLLSSPFYPFLALISLKYLAKRINKIKFMNIIPTIFSFLYPSLSFSSSYDMISANKTNINKYDKMLDTLYYLVPFIFSLYFFIEGDYGLFQFLSISSIFLILLRYWKYLLRIKNQIITFSPYIISISLIFSALYFYYMDLFKFTLLIVSAIAMSFPIKVNPIGLPISFLSLINPIVGIASSINRYSFIFLIIPLIGYLYFHISILTWIFYAIGVILYLIAHEKALRENLILLFTSVIYFSYAMYLFVIGYLTSSVPFLIISIILSLLFMKYRYNSKENLIQLIAYLAVSFPLPIISLPFFFARKRLGIIALLLEGIITILLIKYLAFIHIITMSY